MSLDKRALDKLRERLKQFGDIDASGLMVNWMKVIEEDNRRGVLAGTDKDGNRMRPVAYRPKRKVEKLSDQQRNGAKGRSKRGRFGGFGPMAAGLHNNLTRQEYEALSGPPLAPRGQFSRVITNLRTGFAKVQPNVWEATGLWFEVVSTKGRKFLGAHFKGKNKLPVRDLCGVRPEGREKARKAAVAWMSDQIRWLKTGRHAA